MRHILCNYARDRQRLKRGGGVEHVELDEQHDAFQIELPDDRADELSALDEALLRLEQISERQSQIVECRFFGGMSEEETAAALGITSRTVRRDWVKAKGWLLRDLEQS